MSDGDAVVEQKESTIRTYIFSATDVGQCVVFDADVMEGFRDGEVTASILRVQERRGRPVVWVSDWAFLEVLSEIPDTIVSYLADRWKRLSGRVEDFSA